MKPESGTPPRGAQEDDGAQPNISEALLERYRAELRGWIREDPHEETTDCDFYVFEDPKTTTGLKEKVVGSTQGASTSDEWTQMQREARTLIRDLFQENSTWTAQLFVKLAIDKLEKDWPVLQRCERSWKATAILYAAFLAVKKRPRKSAEGGSGAREKRSKASTKKARTVSEVERSNDRDLACLLRTLEENTKGTVDNSTTVPREMDEWTLNVSGARVRGGRGDEENRVPEPTQSSTEYDWNEWLSPQRYPLGEISA